LNDSLACELGFVDLTSQGQRPKVTMASQSTHTHIWNHERCAVHTWWQSQT